MKFSFLIYLLAVIILGLVFSWRIAWQERPQVLPKNQKITLTATISSEPRISERFQIIQIADGRLFVDLFPRYHVGDRLLVEGYLEDDGSIFNAKVQKVGQKSGSASFLVRLRLKLAANIGKLLPTREATLVLGTVLGVDEIGTELRNNLIKTGTIHVVVVSGQNLSMVAGLFLSLSKFTGRRLSLALSTLAAIFYAALTGFEPPVVRATLMVLAAAVAIFWGRESWPIWNLFLAAIVIIFIWPKAIWEISFQLTFAATLGIVTLGQKFAKSWGKIPVFGENAAIATSAYLFTLPIVLFYFGRASVISPIANMLVAEVIAPIMVLGFITAILSLIWLPLAQLVAFLAYPAAFYFVKVVEYFAKIPVGILVLGEGNFYLLIILYLLILLLITIWGVKSKFN